MGPVKIMRYNHAFDTVISADSRGIIEYWKPDTLKFPEDEYVNHLVFLYPESVPIDCMFFQMENSS